ncbi:MAG: hypothetical protein ACREAU_00130 [Nitrosopumilaceae archaeon]
MKLNEILPNVFKQKKKHKKKKFTYMSVGRGPRMYVGGSGGSVESGGGNGNGGGNGGEGGGE